MTYLENALCTALYQQKLDTLCQRYIDLDTINRNRLFVADTIREVGVTNSIQKRFNTNGELDQLFQMAGVESLGVSVSNEDLANIIAGNEGFINSALNVFNKTAMGFAAEVSNLFLSGWRWFQSLTDSSTADAERIRMLLKTADKNKRDFTKQAISAINLDQVKATYTKINTISCRARACQALRDLSELSVFSDRDVLDQKRKEMAQLMDDVGTAKSAISDVDKQPMVSSEVYRQAKAIAPLVIRALDDIVKTNDTYRGFWHTGFSAGKLSAIAPGPYRIGEVISKLAGIGSKTADAAAGAAAKAAGFTVGNALTIGGTVIGSWLFSDVRTIAGYSWHTISRACSVDYELCRMLMSNLKALNRLDNE